jgi:putative tryptophan/tyrosine transport system substrate-binding protein
MQGLKLALCDPQCGTHAPQQKGSLFAAASIASRWLAADGTRRATGEKVVVFKASNDREIDAAFAAMAEAKVNAMVVSAGEFLTTRRRQIVGLAALHKIPAIYVSRLHTEAGGLMSYGASITDAHRRAGVYVARILKGEKPGDLPVEVPTKFELVINLKTAKALGLTVPTTLLTAADEVIE